MKFQKNCNHSNDGSTYENKHLYTTRWLFTVEPLDTALLTPWLPERERWAYGTHSTFPIKTSIIVYILKMSVKILKQYIKQQKQLLNDLLLLVITS